jgi:BirA family biotin operon repressor/biotin-[acetyl-CoA-carboxylase] ligase
MLKEEKIIEELKKLGVNPPKIIYYELTDSTNTRAKEYAKENPDNKEPVVFIANAQSAGRGRRGRSFISNEGAGIYMSILSYPDKKGADATTVTAKTAVAMTKAVESLCDCDIQIKWVNDLYLGGKKLAGILVEGEMNNEGEIAHQVVGMGINVYKNAISDEICDIATTLESELNSAPDRSVLAARMIKEFLFADNNYYAEYKARSFVIGKEVTVIKLAESYKAKVIDINPDFSLLIEHNGITERLFTGEISLKV